MDPNKPPFWYNISDNQVSIERTEPPIIKCVLRKFDFETNNPCSLEIIHQENQYKLEAVQYPEDLRLTKIKLHLKNMRGWIRPRLNRVHKLNLQ
ncbi:hypothetical protein PEDI_53510 [Persicobacter diffluens]|uniref:Uncharacterized protein n=1 Tax=Persicobacter diffluens TaxID=981 RepID=A0AAN4W304_9BACT|nr:hypothetical protein PEDI_53510 [Persicobacter diffluens]